MAYFVPGYVRVGEWYFAPLSGKAWARLLARVAVRLPALAPLARTIERIYGDALFTNAWDLTTPTAEERRAALREIAKVKPQTLIVNYAFWAELLNEPSLAGIKRVILMHDVVVGTGEEFCGMAITPLDCPVIDEATEMRWLSAAGRGAGGATARSGADSTEGDGPGAGAADCFFPRERRVRSLSRCVACWWVRTTHRIRWV